MTGKRTEEQKILKEGVAVLLGGDSFIIPPLPIKYSLPWCKKVVSIISSVAPMSKIESDDEDAFTKAFSSILIGKPEEMVALFFEYAKSLKRSEVEEKASSAEIVDAFMGVLELERPLLRMTTLLITKTAPEVEEKPKV